MNDEIKQIIEDIKLTLDVTVKDMVLLNRKDIEQLLDYITNLQKKISGLETENQKLWERHNEEYSQISKAIEYIKELLSVTIKVNGKDKTIMTYNKPLYDLLDILKRVDKE